MNQAKLKKVLEKVDQNIADAIEMLYREILIEKKEVSENDWKKIAEILERVNKKESLENKGYYVDWLLSMLDKKKKNINDRMERLKKIKEKAE
jgi:hypothetical protein